MFIIVNFIKDVVSSLVFTESISNLISGPTESQFDSCNTHHVTKGNYIIIDSIEYKVIDFEINSWIAVKGEIPVTAYEYTIPAPNYFNGTPMQVQNVLANIREWRNKLPMVYLLEVIKEQRFNSRTNKLDRISDLRIFFMMASNFQDWDISEHYDLAIEPMDNFVNDFISALRYNATVGEFDEYETINRANFGVYVSKPDKSTGKYQDNITKLIDENISGVELKINLPIKKDPCFSFDDCPSPVPPPPPPTFVNLFSMLFDGVDDFIETPLIAELNSSASATWSCWLKRASATGGYYTMGTWGNTGTDRQMVLFQSSTYIRILIGDAGGYDTAFEGNLTADTDWHNVIITYDGSLSNILKVKVYHDLTSLTNTATGTNVTTLNTSTNGFTIGKLGTGTLGVNQFAGWIDEVSIWDTTLSGTDITAIYGVGIPNDLTSLNPTAWYRMGD